MEQVPPSIGTEYTKHFRCTEVFLKQSRIYFPQVDFLLSPTGQIRPIRMEPKDDP